MKNFFRAMISCKDTIFEKKDRPAADVFVKVRAFVEDGSYSTCKRAKALAEMRLKGCDAHIIAEHFSVAYDTIRTELKKMSKELWGIFPEDFFEKLSDYRENKGYVDSVVSALGYHGSSADNLVLLDVTRSIRNTKRVDSVMKYALDDCQKEIEFLQRYSKAFYEKDLSTVDLQKLRYLIGVLDGEDTVLQQAKLISLVGGVNND